MEMESWEDYKACGPLIMTYFLLISPPPAHLHTLRFTHSHTLPGCLEISVKAEDQCVSAAEQWDCGSVCISAAGSWREMQLEI